jgi:hypothetical protein
MMLLLDAIASIILMGMMLVPIVNLFAGVILGAALGGAPGGVAGFLLAVTVTVAEKMIADRQGWFGAIAEVGDTDVSVVEQKPSSRSGMRQHLLRRRALGWQRSRRRLAALPAAGNYRQTLH